jgi:hypothetical protein
LDDRSKEGRTDLEDDHAVRIHGDSQEALDVELLVEEEAFPAYGRHCLSQAADLLFLHFAHPVSTARDLRSLAINSCRTKSHKVVKYKFPSWMSNSTY